MNRVTTKRVFAIGLLTMLVTGAAACDYNRDHYRDYDRDRDRYDRYHGRDRDGRYERDRNRDWRDRDRRDWERYR
ncbi:MAG: hypothetical protein WD688_02680 [Candidatus Binatia bacterium]